MKRIKNYAFAVLLLGSGAASAAVPDFINFQGRLLDSNKLPRNGLFAVTFKICNTLAGDCSSPLWFENKTVSVANGVFAVQLGSTTALTPGVFSAAARWLDITVEGEALSPREPLAAGPYSFKASEADGLTGNDGSALLKISSVAVGSVYDGALLTGITASKLTGALPAISGGSLSGLTAAQVGLGNVTNDAQVKVVDKDAAGGVAGLTGRSINSVNAAGSITSFLANANTAARTYTLVDRDATFGNNISSVSTSNQLVAASNSALLGGSLIAVPAGKVQIGTVFRWTFTVSKTGGTTLSTFYIRVGTLGTVGDAIVATLATAAGTNVADKGRGEIIFTVRGPLTSSCLGAAHLQLTHNLSTTGLINVPANNIDVSPTTAFDATTPDLYVSLSVTAGVALTFQQVVAEALNL